MCSIENENLETLLGGEIKKISEYFASGEGASVTENCSIISIVENLRLLSFSQRLYLFDSISKDVDEFREVFEKYLVLLDVRNSIEEIRMLYAVSAWKPSGFLKEIPFSDSFHIKIKSIVEILDNYVVRNLSTLSTSLAKKSINEKNSNKLIVCVDNIPADKDSTFVLFLKGRLEVLQRAGYDVRLCFTGEKFLGINKVGDNGKAYTKKFINFHDDFWGRDLNIKPHYISSDVKDITRSFFNYLTEENPGVVFFLGSHRTKITGLFCGLAYYYFPVAIFPLQARQQPTDCFDGIISGIPGYVEEMRKRFSKEKIIRLIQPPYSPTHPFREQPELEDPVENDCADFDEDSFVAVTPLGADRLLPILKNKKIGFEGILTRLLDDNKNMVWVMVGISDAGVKNLLDSSKVYSHYYQKKRLILLPKTQGLKALRKLYKLADAYVSIPGMNGGGGGAILAVEEGLPVIAHKMSDSSAVASNLLMYTNRSEFFSLVSEVVNNSDIKYLAIIESKERLEARYTNIPIEMMREAVREVFLLGLSRLRSEKSFLGWEGRND